MDHKSRESNYLKPRPAVERFARPGLFVVGLLLMVSGMVAAFNPKLQGLSVSTLLAAGFAVLFVGHLGDRLTSIRFREFEARLEKAVTEAEHETERVRREASAALHELEKAAEAYSATRARMEPGGDRDDAMSRDLEDLTKKVQETPPTVERVRSLSRSPDERTESPRSLP